MHGAFQGAGAGRGREGVDDVDGGGEEHRVAAGTGGLAQGDAQVGFAETHRTRDMIRYLSTCLKYRDFVDLDLQLPDFGVFPHE